MKEIVSVSFEGDMLVVKLNDGRRFSVLVKMYPRLERATDEERSNFKLTGRGEGIRWVDIDEDLSAEGFERDTLLAALTTVTAEHAALQRDLDEVRGQYERAVAGWGDALSRSSCHLSHLEAERDSALAGADGARAALAGAAEESRRLRAECDAAYERAAKECWDVSDEFAGMSLESEQGIAQLCASRIRALGGKP